MDSVAFSKVDRSGPWEAAPQVKEKLVNYPCPPCQVPMPVTCLGKHEVGLHYTLLTSWLLSGYVTLPSIVVSLYSYSPLQTINMPCSVAKVSSCGRACGRLLSCTNHSCQLKCHEVIGAADDTTSGDTCQTCDLGCEKPRLEGCMHPCLLTCHKNECPPCGQLIRMRCHCSMMLKHVGCDQWTHGDDRERIRLKSCGCKCPKKVLTDDISF